MPAGKDILLCITKDYLHGLTAVLLTSLSASMSAPILHGCLSPSLMGLLSGNPLMKCYTNVVTGVANKI